MVAQFTVCEVHSASYVGEPGGYRYASWEQILILNQFFFKNQYSEIEVVFNLKCM